MKWRTDTVIQICQTIRQTQDRSALPILADALQDADYSDEDVLRLLRDPNITQIEAERQVALLYSEDSAAAVTWMDGLAEEMGFEDSWDNGAKKGRKMSYGILMEAAESSEGIYQSGSDSWQGFFNPDEFWAAYARITGRVVENPPWTYIPCGC